MNLKLKKTGTALPSGGIKTEEELIRALGMNIIMAREMGMKKINAVIDLSKMDTNRMMEVLARI